MRSVYSSLPNLPSVYGLNVRYESMGRKKTGSIPVPLGDGKFCYAGPTCRIHNKPVGFKADSNNLTLANTVFNNHIEVFREEEQRWLCSQTLSVPSLEGFQKRLLEAGSLARWCEQHKVCHVYNIADFKNGLMFKAQKASTIKLKEELLSQGKPLTELQILSHYMSAKLHSLKGGWRDDWDNLRNLNPEKFDQFHKMNEELHRQHVTNRGANGFHAKKAKQEEVLLVEADKVPDKVLLEFMGCSRKEKYDTDVAAQTSRNLTDPTVNVYKCRFCPSYHLGHGNGDLTVEESLNKARQAWKRYPDKANEIVKKYNLHN